MTRHCFSRRRIALRPSWRVRRERPV